MGGLQAEDVVVSQTDLVQELPLQPDVNQQQQQVNALQLQQQQAALQQQALQLQPRMLNLLIRDYKNYCQDQ